MDPQVEEQVKQRAQQLFDEAMKAIGKEGLAIPEVVDPLPKPAVWLEVWTKLRPFVVDFLIEAIIFGLFLLSLEAFHRLLDKTSLHPDDILLLHKFHFYSHFAVLVIFAISFIIQVLFRKYEELFEVKKP